MEKPRRPIEPDIRDRIKYPLETRTTKGMTQAEAENTPYIRDYRKYQKERDEYPKLLEKWEQLKLAKIIINMAKGCEGKEDKVQKKIVEKFKITKR